MGKEGTGDEDEGEAETGEADRPGGGASGDGASGSRASGDADPPEVIIDFDGLADRIIDAPGMGTNDYAGLAPGPAGTVFVLGGGSAARKYSIEDRDAEDFIEQGGRVAISHDRTHLLYYSGGWRIVGTARPPSGGDGALDLGNMRVRVDPTAEYAQMLRDGWRFMRDFLYVDNQHGAPVGRRMGLVLGVAPGRAPPGSDFNHLLDMLSGEIAVGHSYVRGGDYPDLESPRTGLLGADLAEDGGFYRITRIYDGGDWTPGLAGPLSHPGMDVQEGDYLLAVDGAELRATHQPLPPPGGDHRTRHHPDGGVLPIRRRRPRHPCPAHRQRGLHSANGPGSRPTRLASTR